MVIVIGGLGPAIAAAVTIWRSGGSLLEWARDIVRWRMPIRYYLYALGLPVLIMLGMNLVLSVLGQQPAWSSLLDRVPAYLQTFLLTAVIFGGQEEPGWRGFALPHLQSRHSPMLATLILGLAWGIWHVPRSDHEGHRLFEGQSAEGGACQSWWGELGEVDRVAAEHRGVSSVSSAATLRRAVA